MSEAEILVILKEETGEEWALGEGMLRTKDGCGGAWRGACGAGAWRVYVKGSKVHAGSDLRTVTRAAVAERAARKAARPNLREVQCCATCVFCRAAVCHHMNIPAAVDARGEVCDAWTVRGEG